MRTADLFEIGKIYLKYGFMIAMIDVLLEVLILLIRKNKAKQYCFSISQIICHGALITFLTVVIGATSITRYYDPSNVSFKPLLYSYHEAWNRFSPLLWRNILLNIAMFLPLGVLLPLSFKIFRKWYCTYFVGFFLSFAIECVQKVFHLGIFEVDDILNNTLGVMIGFGIYALGAFTVFFKKNKQFWFKALFFQLPLIIFALAFAIIFLMYNNKELGNLPDDYISRISSKYLKIKYSFIPDDTSRELNAYSIKIYSHDEAKQKAIDILSYIEADICGEQSVDKGFVFYAKDSSGTQYSLTFYYIGGEYSLRNLSFLKSEVTSYVDVGEENFDPITIENVTKQVGKKAGASESEIREALKNYGINPPSGGNFIDNGYGSYSMIYDFQPFNDNFPYGKLNVIYYDNGKFELIDYSIQNCVKTNHAFDCISENEALDKLFEGKFHYDQQIPYDGLSIELNSVNIFYVLDTKNYYQPVYRFNGIINSETSVIDIPAIR